jgi:hypothetical protein
MLTSPFQDHECALARMPHHSLISKYLLCIAIQRLGTACCISAAACRSKGRHADRVQQQACRWPGVRYMRLLHSSLHHQTPAGDSGRMRYHSSDVCSERPPAAGAEAPAQRNSSSLATICQNPLLRSYRPSAKTQPCSGCKTKASPPGACSPCCWLACSAPCMQYVMSQLDASMPVLALVKMCLCACVTLCALEL